MTIDDKVFALGENKYGVLGLGHENEVKEVEIIPELCDKRLLNSLMEEILFCVSQVITSYLVGERITMVNWELDNYLNQKY